MLDLIVFNRNLHLTETGSSTASNSMASEDHSDIDRSGVTEMVYLNKDRRGAERLKSTKKIKASTTGFGFVKLSMDDFVIH